MTPTRGEVKLDVARLENVRDRGNKIESACPACREEGRDRTGNHLVIYQDGRFGCVANPEDHEHRKRIWQLAGGAGTNPGDYLPAVPLPKPPEPLQAHSWPDLEPGTDKDLRRLSNLRGIGVEGLRLARDRGILHFFDHAMNGRSWAVSDSSRHVRQDRRIEGQPFILADSTPAKSRTMGKPCWPVGASEIEGFENVLFCEGGPDLLAAHHLIYCDDRQKDTAAVAMLGAGQPIHQDAIERFRGTRVRFFMHTDRGGRKGVRQWWKAVQSVASKVDAYDFQGLKKLTGEPVNDLNDFLHVDVDQWEEIEHVRDPLP